MDAADGFERAVRDALERRFSVGGLDRLELHPLGGGLESTCVRVRAWLGDGRSAQPRTFVAKRAGTWAAREALVYQRLARSPFFRELAPTCFGIEPLGGGDQLLLLEEVRQESRWPWAELETSTAVIDCLARLHGQGGLPRSFDSDGWDYEQDLQASAEETLALVERCGPPSSSPLGRALPAMRRLVRNLPSLRRELAGNPRFGQVLLHGDVHTGNVRLVHGPAGPRVVLIDWARARLGSVLEDVSSWTLSLGLWEPQARRRHDTLLRAYLLARGDPPELDPELRAHYWLAASSNALAGAIRYHLAELGSRAPGTPPDPGSLYALQAAARVIRRADVYWRCAVPGQARASAQARWRQSSKTRTSRRSGPQSTSVRLQVRGR